MLHGTFKILLIGMLLCCPLLCSALEQRSTSSESTASRCHCSAHKNADIPARQPQHNSQRDLPQGSIPVRCQCICDGALKADVSEIRLAPQTSVCEMVLVDCTVSSAMNSSRLPSEAFPDVGWVPSGRELCCLHSMLRC